MSLIVIGILITTVNAQVFNAGNTLSKGKFSATGAPVFYDGGTLLLGKIGYGIDWGTDLSLNMGFGDQSYLGVDAEKILTWEDLDNLTMSYAVGLHYSSGFGLDGNLNLTVPLDKSLDIYSGLDMDIQLTDGSAIPIYWFVGAEYVIKRRLALLGELDFGLSDAGNMLGFGLCYYFNGISIK